MQDLVDVTVPVFLLIGAGYLSVRIRLLTAENIRGLMLYAQSIAIPCLMFRAISQLDFRSDFDSLHMLSFYAGSLCAFLLGLAGARFIFHRSPEESVAIGFAALFGNTVLIGLAIIERAYGGETLDGTYLVVACHTPFCYLVGITTMEVARSPTVQFVQTARNVIRGMFHNAIMVGIAAGFIFSVLDLPVPALAGGVLDMFRLTALPVALFGLGGILVQYRPEGDLKVIAMVCALALFVHPMVTWLLSGRVFELDRALIRSAVITASMAPGVNAYIFADMYGSARRVAATSVLVGTAISILSVSCWILVIG